MTRLPAAPLVPSRPRSPRLLLVRLGVSEEYGPQQLGLATVVALAPAAFFTCLVLGAEGVSWWWLVLAPVTVPLAARPESSGHLMLWAVLLVVWVGAVPDPVTWWSVPAALVVAVSHTALTLLAGRPAAGDLAADTPRRVGRRLGVVAAVVVGVAVLAHAVRTVGVQGRVALVAAALLVLALWVWWGGRRVDETDGDAHDPARS